MMNQAAQPAPAINQEQVDKMVAQAMQKMTAQSGNQQSNPNPRQ